MAGTAFIVGWVRKMYQVVFEYLKETGRGPGGDRAARYKRIVNRMYLVSVGTITQAETEAEENVEMAEQAADRRRMAWALAAADQ